MNFRQCKTLAALKEGRKMKFLGSLVPGWLVACLLIAFAVEGCGNITVDGVDGGDAATVSETSTSSDSGAYQRPEACGADPMFSQLGMPCASDAYGVACPRGGSYVCASSRVLCACAPVEHADGGSVSTDSGMSPTCNGGNLSQCEGFCSSTGQGAPTGWECSSGNARCTCAAGSTVTDSAVTSDAGSTAADVVTVSDSAVVTDSGTAVVADSGSAVCSGGDLTACTPYCSSLSGVPSGWDCSSGNVRCTCYVPPVPVVDAGTDARDSAVADSATADTGCVRIEYCRDRDGDGYGNRTDGVFYFCGPTPGYVPNGDDCNDNNASIFPGATEVCSDGVDNNCNGRVDTADTACACSNRYYRDSDGDGYGNPALSTVGCSAPAGYVSNNTDCNDGRADIRPNATETCDGEDDNCDSHVDEVLSGASWTTVCVSTCTTRYYRDADGDGYGNAANSTVGTGAACSAPAGYVSNNTDCDDTRAIVNPGAMEICADGFDNNCNGQIDSADSACASTATAPVVQIDNSSTFTNVGYAYGNSTNSWIDGAWPYTSLACGRSGSNLRCTFPAPPAGATQIVFNGQVDGGSYLGSSGGLFRTTTLNGRACTVTSALATGGGRNVICPL